MVFINIWHFGEPPILCILLPRTRKGMTFVANKTGAFLHCLLEKREEGETRQGSNQPLGGLIIAQVIMHIPKEPIHL